MLFVLATFHFLWSKSVFSGSRSSRGRPLSHSLHHVMKHCKGSAFLRGSVKSDPLDAWGEESELEIEGGRLINPPSSLFQPRPKSRCKEKEETEKEDIWKAATSSLPHRLLRGLSRALCYPRAWILSGCKREEKTQGRKKKIVAHVCI